MKCLFGIYKKDEGSIFINGSEVNFTGPKDALEHGVAMIHQELNQVVYSNVMENLWMGRIPKKGILIDEKKMYEDTKKLLDELAISIDPGALLKDLSVSKRQMIEIAKATSYKAQILVLDEPTSSLTNDEVEHLFKIMRKLCDNGVGIIYISHKMDEIKQISDEITIMRDGKWISTDSTDSLTKDEIITRMVARKMSQQFPKSNKPNGTLLSIRNLSDKNRKGCNDVSFDLKKK